MSGKSDNSGKTSFFVAFAVIVLLVWAGMWLGKVNGENSGFEGSFVLTDHNGNKVTEADFADKYKLVYFGFTYCPAVCPTELQKDSIALEKMGEAAKNIQFLFITVDPERDTVKMLSNYVQLFHPSLIGLTGSIEQIENVKQKFGVYSKKVDDPSMSEYTVDHSAFSYFLDKKGKILAVYKVSDTAEYITQDMMKRMGRDTSHNE